MESRIGKCVTRLRQGVARFAPFNVGAVLLVVTLIWYNHVPRTCREADGLLPSSLAYGICWGMLAALTTRLFMERKAVRSSLANIVPVFVGIAASTAGAWFWFHVREGHPFGQAWQMLYFGGITTLTSAALYMLFGKHNGRTLWGQIFQYAVLVWMVSFVAMLGALLCVEAYSELIDKVPGALFEDVMLVIWCAIAPVFMAAMLPKDDVPTEQSRWYDILFWFITPLGIVLLAVLYAYIAKIVIHWEMPSGKMNWFASCALSGYLFLWLSLRGSRVRVFSFLARWGWASLVPVVVTQIVGIVIRYQAYGLTTPCMAGMVTLAIGIYALVLAALDRDARSIFAVTAVAGIVFTVSPLNIVDIPLRDQESRLHKVLKRNGCLAPDGSLSVPKAVKIPLSDAKALIGASKYLANVYAFSGLETNTLPVRAGVWYKSGLIRSVLGDTFAKRQDWDLPALLNIEENNLKKPGEVKGLTMHDFRLDERDELDIRDFAVMRRVQMYKLECERETGRYSIRIEGILPSGNDSAARTSYDVTGFIDRIVKESGAEQRWENGSYDNRYRLSSEHAIWRLSDDVSLVVTDLSIHIPPLHADFPIGSVRAILLRRR